MFYDTSLWLFFVMVFGIIALPGMDMAFVLSNALVGGKKAGLYAVAGIVAGGICHVIAATLGIGVVIQLVPGLKKIMLLGGSAYVAWIGLSILRSHAALGMLPAVSTPPPSVIFRQAVITCLVNPKAYLFMLAVFPQFLHPNLGPLWPQAVQLGAVITLTQLCIYGSLAMSAGHSRQWLTSSPRTLVWLSRSVGGLLIAGALWTVGQGWKSA